MKKEKVIYSRQQPLQWPSQWWLGWWRCFITKTCNRQWPPRWWNLWCDHNDDHKNYDFL